MSFVDAYTIADAVADYAEQYRVRKAYLFGSYVRGDADAISDIDICIEPAEGFTLFYLGGFGQHLEDALGTPVDIVCGEDSFYPRAHERYRKDRVLLYEEPNCSWLRKTQAGNHLGDGNG